MLENTFGKQSAFLTVGHGLDTACSCLHGMGESRPSREFVHCIAEDSSPESWKRTSRIRSPCSTRDGHHGRFSLPCVVNDDRSKFASCERCSQLFRNVKLSFSQLSYWRAHDLSELHNDLCAPTRKNVLQILSFPWNRADTRAAINANNLPFMGIASPVDRAVSTALGVV